MLRIDLLPAPNVSYLERYVQYPLNNIEKIEEMVYHKNMKKLYISDLDGTLLNNKGKLSEYTIQIINELIGKGIYFSYATARSLISASSVTGGLNIKIPVITKNGIFIEKLDTKEKIYSLKFSEEDKLILAEILEEYSIYPIVYSFINGTEKKSWLKDKENDAIRSEINSLKGDPRYRPVNSLRELYFGEIYHINCMGSKNELTKIYKYPEFKPQVQRRPDKVS